MLSARERSPRDLWRRPRHARCRIQPMQPLRCGTVALLVAFILAVSACGSGDAPTEPTGSSGDASTEATGSTAAPEVAVDTPTTGTTSPPEKPPESDATVALGWTPAGLSGETFIDQLLATGQGFVAYRFAHGSQTWVSEDGIDWTPTDLLVEATTDEFDLYSITAGGLGYVALGSDTGGDNDVVWTSVDGFTWTPNELDLEYPDLGVFASIGLMSVVGGPDGLLLVGRMDREGGGPDEHGFVVWTSADGSEWILVEDPFGAGAYIEDIVPFGQGFLTYGHIEGDEDTRDLMWWSPNGRSWEEVSTDFLHPGSTSNEGFAQRPALGFVLWGDKILAAAETEDGIRLWTSTDGRAWEQLAASPSLDHTDQFILSGNQVAAGPHGIVLMGELQPPRQALPPVVLERDDLIVTVDLESGRLIVTDRSTGKVLLDANAFESDFVVIDEEDGSVTVFDPDTGEELTTFTFEEFEQAQAKAFEEAGIEAPEFREDQPTSVLWFSPDGQRWTSVGIEETFGSVQFPQDIVVGNHALILRWSGIMSPGTEEEFEEQEFEDPPDVIWVGRLTDRNGGK